tara:strand:+ start:1936 stop:9363 length:7428 start_codon:yes stop_codon:yes gene_type:complete
MSDIDYTQYQKNVCDDAPELAPKKTICPTCVPNKDYIEPDWTKLVEEPYLNEKTCEYSICVTVDKHGDSYTARDFRNYPPGSNRRKRLLRGFIQPALILMLDEYGKLIADQIICANHNGPAVTGMTADELLETYDDFEVAYDALKDDPSLGLDTCPELDVVANDVGNIKAGEAVSIHQLTSEVLSKLPQVTNPYALELYAKVSDFYIDPVQQLLKVLITVPAFMFERVPNSPTKEELEDEATSTRGEVILDVEELWGQIKRLQVALSIYAKYQSFFYQTQDGFLGWRDEDVTDKELYKDYYASVYSGKIKTFYEELKELSKTNGFNIRSELPSVFLDNARLVKIEFDTSDSDKPYIIKRISAKKKGCPWVEYDKSLGKTTPDGFFYKYSEDMTLMNYIAKLKEIDLSLRARQSYPWLDFLVKFTYPLLTVHYGWLNNEQVEQSAGACVAENAAEFGIDLKDYILNESLSLAEAFAFQYSHKNSCFELGNMENEPEKVEFDKEGAKAKVKALGQPRRDKKLTKEMLSYDEKDYQQMENNLKAEKFKRTQLIQEAQNALVEYQYQVELEENNANLNTGPGSFNPLAKPSTEELRAKVQEAQKEVRNSTARVKEIEEMLSKKGRRQHNREVNRLGREQAKKARASRRDNHPYVKKARELAMEEFLLQDSFLTTILNFDDFAAHGFGGLKFNKVKKFDLKDLMSRMSLCNFTSILTKAMRCLFSGVTEEAALKKIVQAALEAMDLDVFEIFIRNLPPESQEELREAFEKEFGDLPLPWEEGYDAGHLNNTNAYIKYLKNPPAEPEPEPEPTEDAPEIDNEALEAEALRKEQEEQQKAEQAEQAEASWANYVQGDQYHSAEQNQKIKRMWYEFSSVVSEVPMYQNYKSWWKSYPFTGHGSHTETIAALQEKIDEAKDIRDLVEEMGDEDDALYEQEQAEARRQAREAEEAAAETKEDKETFLQKKWKELSEKDRGQIKASINAPTFGTQKELGPPGTYGKALGNIQQLIMEVYIKNMIDLLELDELLQLLERFPGGELLPRFLSEARCATQGMFNPPIKSFLSTFSLDVCGDKGFGIAWPKQVQPIPNFFDGSLLARLKPIFVGQVEKVIVQVMQSMILKILESVDGAICDSIHAIGLKLSTGSGLDEAMQEAFCPDGNDNDVKNVKDSLFLSSGLAKNLQPSGQSPYGAGDLIGEGQPPQVPNLGDVGDDTFDCLYRVLNSCLSKQEALALLTTPPSQMDQAVLQRIAELVNALCPQFSDVFGTPELIAGVFGNCGLRIPPELREWLRDQVNAQPEGPIYDNVCLSQEEFERWNDQRRRLLTNSGLDLETAQDMIDQANDRVLDSLGDLAKIMQKGPEGMLADALDNLLGGAPPQSPRGQYPLAIDPWSGKPIPGPAGPPYATDPACTVDPTAILFDATEEDNKNKIATMRNFFEPIEKTFLQELINGRNGVLNNILRDKNNFRLKKHERRTGVPFWNPDYVNSEDDWQFRKENSNIIMRLRMEEAVGTYPETVGAYMRSQLESQNVGYNTAGSKTKITFDYEDSKDQNYLFQLNYEILYNDRQESRLVIDETINKRIKRKERKKLEEQGIEVPKGGSLEILGATDILVKNHTPVAPYNDFIYTGNVPYESLVFKSMFQAKTGSPLDANGTLQVVYNSAANMLLNFTKEAMITNSDGGVSTGFNFGYNDQEPIRFMDLLYVNPDADPNDKSTWKYTHLPREKVLGKSATENPRVHFLDPAIHGGTYMLPKIYIEPATYNGWMGMMKTFIPEVDECEDVDNGFLNITSLAQRVKDVENNLPFDERLSMAPDCRVEAPYDKHASPASHGIMEGVVLGTLRVYITEFILKTIPTFGSVAFNPHNVNEALVDLLVDELRKGLTEQTNRLNVIQGYTYYLLFLEQAVQVVQRQTQDGLMLKTEEMKIAGEVIDEAQINYDPVKIDVRNMDFKEGRNLQVLKDIYKGSAIIGFGENWEDEYNKTVNVDSVRDAASSVVTITKLSRKLMLLSPFKIRLARKINTIYNTREAAEVMLRELLKSEMGTLMKKLTYNMRPVPHVHDIQKYLLSRNGIVVGSSLRSGESVIENPPVEGSTGFDYGDVLNVVRNVDTENPLAVTELTLGANNISVPSGYENFADFLSSGITIRTRPRDLKDIVKQKALELITIFQSGVWYLEKYLRVTEKDGTEQVYNIAEFQEILKNLPDQDKKISDYYGNPYVLGGKLQGSIGIKFGVRLVYSPPPTFDYTIPEGREKERSYQLGPAVLKVKFADSFYDLLGDLPVFISDMLRKALGEIEFPMPSASRSVPMVTFEENLMDQKISELDLEDPNMGQELKCYIDNLVKENDFQILFGYCFPVKTYVSLFATYSYYGFFESIGKDEDNDEEMDKDPSKLREGWKAKVFRRTKKLLRRQFNSAYRTDDDERKEDQRKETKQRSARFMKNILPNAYLNLDGSVRWWQSFRIVEIKPFDPQGKPCLNGFQKMFR